MGFTCSPGGSVFVSTCSWVGSLIFTLEKETGTETLTVAPVEGHSIKPTRRQRARLPRAVPSTLGIKTLLSLNTKVCLPHETMAFNSSDFAFMILHSLLQPASRPLRKLGLLQHSR